MKNFNKYLLSGLFLLFAFNPVFADTEIITVNLGTNPKPDYPELPPVGPRMPSVSYTCTVDFSSYSIDATVPYDIITYQLWYGEGDTMLVSYPYDQDMVVFMSQITGTYQLRIETTDYTYIGYIDL